ncbi:PAS domain S-box protein [Gracilinema caldarium]|uniref:PAS domain S-box protein n=1 Tax=Gracilinema caldarium TaxID=215591 RepID=UPI0026ECF236|nr:PAS domain S-box protein [Gracilinema caldarium]
METILLIEDDRILASAEKKLLERKGFSVTVAETGEQGIELLEEGFSPDIILMDYNLGEGLDGVKTAEFIQMRWDIPIVYLSSSTDPEYLKKMEQSASYGFVLKSSSVEVLSLSIRMALRLHESQKKAAEKDRLYHQLYSTMHQGVLYYDESGKIIDANPAAVSILGLSRDQMNNLIELAPSWKAIKLDGSPLSEQDRPIQVTLSTGKAVTNFIMGIFREDLNQYRWISVDTIPLQESFAPYKVYSTLDDITDRIVMEKEMDNLFVQMHNGFALHEIIVNDQGNPIDYRFLKVNPAFEKLTGLSAQDIIGKRVLEVLPNTESYWIETYGKVALTGETITFQNYSAELKRYYEVSAYRPAPGQFAVIVSDVTDRKLAEVALQGAYEEKTTLLKELQHRVKNSFAMIESMVQLAADAYVSEDAAQALKEIQFRISAVSQLYSQLHQSSSFNVVDSYEYFNQLLESMTEFSPLILTTHIDALKIPVKIATSLGIMLTELVTNSLKYAYPKDSPGELIVTLTQNDTDLVLHVQDKGKGLPENFVIKNSSGLGLNLVNALAQQMKGSFSINGSNGTTSIIRIPKEVIESL